jgi:hypothetical protein
VTVPTEPRTQAEWDTYWRRYDALIEAKRADRRSDDWERSVLSKLDEPCGIPAGNPYAGRP